MRVGLFPGQGLDGARVLTALEPGHRYTAMATAVLGYDLREALAHAVEEDRTPPTTIMQPAIMTASMISWDLLYASKPPFDFLAGHSLGEYAALVAAEGFSFEDAVRVLVARGEAMQRVSQISPGGMAAALKLEYEQMSEIAERAGVEIANDNAAGQVVLSGSYEGLERAGAMVEAAGGRFAPLDIVGPFHTAAVEPAVPLVRARLDEIEVRSPRIPVVSNVTARPFGDPDEIRALLVRNLIVGVRWRETLEWLWDQGVRDYEDVGPGNVVGKLAKRTFSLLRPRGSDASDTTSSSPARSTTETDGGRGPSDFAPQGQNRVALREGRARE